MKNGWKVTFINSGGDKPKKEIVVLAVEKEGFVEEVFEKYVETKFPQIKSEIENVKFEKIGPFFNFTPVMKEGN